MITSTTGYKAYRGGTSYTALLNQNWLQSTHIVHSTLLILGQVDMEVSTMNSLNQPVMESNDQVQAYTALILTPAYQFFAGYWLQRKLQLLLHSPSGLSGIVFTHGVRIGGWVGGRHKKVCSGCISETARCRKLILGRDIG